MRLRRPTRIALTRLAMSVLVAGLAACAAFADKADYADYRAVRLAVDERARSVARYRYVRRHPNGRWHQQIQTERRRNEGEVFDAHRHTKPGLQHYLEAYPDGTFVQQARARLRAMEQLQKRRQQERKEQQQLAEKRKARETKLRQTWITRFFTYWAQTLLSLRDWGKPVPEVARANPEFSRAFGASPRPRCTREECVKYYTSRFGIPVPGGTRLERSVDLILRLLVREGRLTGAELLMPKRGFSRWFELENSQPIVDEDPMDRQQAADWAMNKVVAILAQVRADFEPLEGFASIQIRPPALGPDGQLVDTSAPDPASPGEPDHSPPTDGHDTAEAPTPAEDPPDPAETETPDMVMEPLEIPVSTEPEGGPPPAPDLATKSSADRELSDAPQSPPTSASQSAPADAASSSAASAPAQYSVRAFAATGLRVISFAAIGVEPLPGYDGLIIEPSLEPSR